MPDKILIVDDEPFNLDLLEQELMDYDYVIERAVDGVQALEKIDSFAPDVILLDFMMPKMNGLEVVKRLRSSDKHKRIPVILLTAKATQEDKAFVARVALIRAAITREISWNFISDV